MTNHYSSGQLYLFLSSLNKVCLKKDFQRKITGFFSGESGAIEESDVTTVSGQGAMWPCIHLYWSIMLMLCRDV